MSFKPVSKCLQLSTTEKIRQKLSYNAKKQTKKQIKNRPKLKSGNSQYFYTSGSFILDSNPIIYYLAIVTRVLRASCAKGVLTGTKNTQNWEKANLTTHFQATSSLLIQMRNSS